MVVGDSRTGKIIHFQVFYHLCELFAGLKTWGVVPQTGNFRLDVIPSDYVARGLYLASSRPEAAGRIFHLCSGPEYAPRLADMLPAIHRAFRARGRELPRLRHISPAWMRTLAPLIALCMPPKTRRLFQGLPFLLAYLDEEPVFDNTKSREFFEGLGLWVPPVNQYLGKVLDYYCTARDRARARPGPVSQEAAAGRG
jgi:nucleoside-diphosphate-sugar epimerase